MPTPTEIVASLTDLAHRAFTVAVAWHVAVLWCAITYWVGFRPTQRAATMLLSAPLASVALLAGVFDSPFNAVVFTVAALGLAWLAARAAPSAAPASVDPWSQRLGTVLVAFGWVYPHFLVSHSPLVYLYAAPLGVLPCPTLSFVVGVALLGGGLVGGTWRISLSLLAAFYGLFGALRLGVWMDLVLLVGAAGLAVQHWQTSQHHTGTIA